jgi:hypothetical protein
MSRRLWWAPLAAVAVALMCEPAFAQCAMCRQALQSPEGRQMISAFRSGIVLLLLTPFAVFGTVATLAIRRSRRRQRAA